MCLLNAVFTSIFFSEGNSFQWSVSWLSQISKIFKFIFWITNCTVSSHKHYECLWNFIFTWPNFLLASFIFKKCIMISTESSKLKTRFSLSLFFCISKSHDYGVFLIWSLLLIQVCFVVYSSTNNIQKKSGNWKFFHNKRISFFHLSLLKMFTS